MLLAVSSYGKFTLFLIFTFVAHHAVFQYCLFKYVSSAVALCSAFNSASCQELLYTAAKV